ALYHPEHGYYRRDRFGREGDYFTASQLQPVFGLLIAARVRMLRSEMGGDFRVVELGPGRGEMAGALAEFGYSTALHGPFRGVVFSNEFFDALPVHRVLWEDAQPRLARVGWSGERFNWVTGEPAGGEIAAYVEKYFPGAGLWRSAEVNLDALRWMERIASLLDEGFVFAIDYGYRAAEARRFPDGTLMSYRRHTALEDVLVDPGERDITAHVNFSALEDAAGFTTVRSEPLARTLLEAGEADQFAAALAGDERRKLQLKTLLFGMGETFRTLLQRREK
ncbi:MAG: SAM-dependent methyltransferase, partial [Bryobacteraceae bacterium]